MNFIATFKEAFDLIPSRVWSLGILVSFWVSFVTYSGQPFQGLSAVLQVGMLFLFISLVRSITALPLPRHAHIDLFMLGMIAATYACVLEDFFILSGSFAEARANDQVWLYIQAVADLSLTKAAFLLPMPVIIGLVFILIAPVHKK